MKKLFLLLALAWASPALAVVPQTTVGDANYSISSTDQTVITTTVFTANRTWTLPSAGGTCIGQSCPALQLSVLDLAKAFAWNHTLTLTPATGETINGNTGSIILTGAGANAFLTPTSGTNWSLRTQGDLVSSGLCTGTGSTATVTITIAAPGVFTDTAHGFQGACPVIFTNSGGGLPTGITSGTTYYVTPSSITNNSYSVSTTVANALAGTSVTTTGTSTGTQTRTSGVVLSTNTAADITGVSLSQGDWECRSTTSRNLGASTSVTVIETGHNPTTATLLAQGRDDTNYQQTAANVMGVLGPDQKVGPSRQNLTATTTIFLTVKDTFTVSTDNAYGVIACRRAQ